MSATTSIPSEMVSRSWAFCATRTHLKCMKYTLARMYLHKQMINITIIINTYHTNRAQRPLCSLFRRAGGPSTTQSHSFLATFSSISPRGTVFRLICIRGGTTDHTHTLARNTAEININPTVLDGDPFSIFCRGVAGAYTGYQIFMRHKSYDERSSCSRSSS